MRILFAVFFAALSAVLLLGAGSVLYVATSTILGWELGILVASGLVWAVFQRFWPRGA